jgi:hypothetical protein
MDRNSDVWSLCHIWYDHYSLGLSQRHTEKLLGVKVNRLRAIFKRFKAGWIPNEDPVWVSKFTGDTDGS